ncbi:hypothetical protein CAEBREN_10626 [Caenorhabditis brenneri]|uniref:C3H1-type domain-containing protein n=1 Tax=Caenorhabditis brenneri TaxID=135651 RepID=G0MDG1_CAEBE|nr:hypothetical protein CAEBREN_10626 [Caenorhabditis brenneri]
MLSPFNFSSVAHLLLDTSKGENPHHEENPDGTSNYSSDTYCQLYDEKIGYCPNGDACPHLHGDIERQYHVNVFKTLPCEYELNEYGFCELNGRICPHAHGPEDMRMRVLTPAVGDLTQHKLGAHEEDQIMASYKKEQCFTKNFSDANYNGSWDRRVEMHPWRPVPRPDLKKISLFEVPVILPNHQKFDIFGGQIENNCCIRCGRDTNGSGMCPICSKQPSKI